jgi:transposase-like protein
MRQSLHSFRPPSVPNYLITDNLVLNHKDSDWKNTPREWFEARTQFAVIFGERFMGQ